MVFALGAEHLSGISDHSRQPGALSMQDLVRIRDKFFARAQALLPRVLSGSSLSNIQALLLIALYLHQTNERGATWNLIGSAIRMAFALGLHRRGAGRGARVGLLERELRKQVWWTLYMFERFLCSTLGRPSAINDDDVDVNRPSKGLLDVSEHTPLGHLEQSVSLWRIVGRICKSVYDPIKRPTSEHATTEAFLSELNAWYDALPPHLALVSPQPPSHRRAVVCLHVEYHQAICLLTRPLLLLKVAGKPPRADEHHDALARCNLPNTCVASARTCVELLSQLAADDIFNARTWMDVYYAYTSAMILSLPLLWGNRQWSQPERGVIPSATIEEDDMRYGVGQCLALLSELRMSGTMARFAEVVRNLSKAIGLSSRGPLVDANGSRRDGDSTRRNSYRDPALANLELLSQMSVNPTAASGDVSAHFLQPHGTNLTDGLSSELFFGPPFPLLSTAPNSNSPEELPTGPAVGNVTLGSDGTDPLSFPELMVNWTCDEIGSLLLHELDPAAFLWPGA